MSHRCAFDGCPLGGSMSTNITGGGPYYCRYHFRDHGRYALQVPPAAYYPDRMDWRDAMRAERSLPDLARGHGEARSHYRQRTLAAVREAAAKAAAGTALNPGVPHD